MQTFAERKGLKPTGKTLSCIEFQRNKNTG
jgi:hypothetical protein